jgi:uncharacterized LabA/DUF88 family protein
MPDFAIFADVQNIYYTTRQAYGRQFDYRALWDRVAALGTVVAATAYAIDRGDPQQRKFQSALSHIGFDVRLKPFIERRDGSAKGDWDVGITIDVINAAAAGRSVILLSGDGDFACLMTEVRERYGLQAIAFGVPALSARALMDAANVFYPIDEGLLL